MPTMFKPIAHDIVGNYAPAVYEKDSAAYYVNGTNLMLMLATTPMSMDMMLDMAPMIRAGTGQWPVQPSDCWSLYWVRKQYDFRQDTHGYGDAFLHCPQLDILEVGVQMLATKQPTQVLLQNGYAFDPRSLQASNKPTLNESF